MHGRHDNGVTQIYTLYPVMHDAQRLPVYPSEHVVHRVPLEQSGQLGIASVQRLHVKGPVVWKYPVSQESQRFPRYPEAHVVQVTESVHALQLGIMVQEEQVSGALR